MTPGNRDSGSDPSNGDEGLPQDPWLRLRLTALDLTHAEYVKQLVAEDLSEPVLVWQMGKVASRSFVDAIEDTRDYAVFHLHHTNVDTIRGVRERYDRQGEQYPKNLKLSLELLEVVGALREANDRKVRIVSAVRDPLARNVSAFFQNLKLFAGDRPHDPDSDAERLTEIFVDEYVHSIPLAWFDRELRATMGIDVYATPYDRERARLRLSNGAFDVLILRAEDDDDAKQAALNEFFGRDDLRVGRSNVGSEKGYAELYESFLEKLAIPRHLLDLVYDSQLCRHFYTDEERSAMRSAWRTA